MLRWLGGGLAVCVLAMVLGVATRSLASPPAGTPPKTPKQAYEKAEVVFVGRVESVSKDKLGFVSQAEVRVEKYWKGGKLLGKTVRIDGAGGPTHPARIFAKGKRYLFYLPAPGARGNGKHTFRADSFLHRVLVLEKAISQAEKAQPRQSEDDMKYLSQFESRVPN